MNDAESLIRSLPEPGAAERFLEEFGERSRSQLGKLRREPALLSDVLTLVSYSPLLASTLLQKPEYVSWLERERKISGVRGKEDLLESLARFSLTNSQVEPHVLLSRFRRRELLRIFLSDIRRLATVAETTEDISNLADAILEYALRLERQELDNRFGVPLETDEKGRSRPAKFCVVSLGKLGSKELNYSSDIDLLFLYSADGRTSETGTRDSVTNREYFIKLAEAIVRLVGQQAGEGSAYRVDLRLRPHGRVGPLALSVEEAVRYYTTAARSWERQVLIRSRASAGEGEVFRDFFTAVESSVFSPDETVERALENVRLSKQKIDLNRRPVQGYDVKLDPGGIREIEFIAQALQLAFGGRDKWLRAPHTLISLTRIADRHLLSEKELNSLFDAYEFLRRLEHVLQMENGLQTHLLPADHAKRSLVAARMRCDDLTTFETELTKHTKAVSDIFKKVFGPEFAVSTPLSPGDANLSPDSFGDVHSPDRPGGGDLPVSYAAATPRFAELLERNANALENFQVERAAGGPDYRASLERSIGSGGELGTRLGGLRRAWQAALAGIVAAEVSGTIPIREAKVLQLRLAEESLRAAIEITRCELERRYRLPIAQLPLAVLGLGKLGGGGVDYDSDLDIVLVYDKAPEGIVVTPAEFYSRAAEILVTALSGVTREGSLYRVDLRLRPYGKNGLSAISRAAFAEYMQRKAAVWELLAYVKMRAAGGDIELGRAVEDELRQIIFARAAATPAEVLARETREMRLRLERERSRSRRHGEIDIKYGPGGMLDVYFAMRYLQLRDGIPDDPLDRSTDTMLTTLLNAGSLDAEAYTAFVDGYRFVSALDHAIRLTVGRTTRLPVANQQAIKLLASRLGASDPSVLLDQLNLHRLQIRTAFDRVLPD